jgi:hypothetical protein
LALHILQEYAVVWSLFPPALALAPPNALLPALNQINVADETHPLALLLALLRESIVAKPYGSLSWLPQKFEH